MRKTSVSFAVLGEDPGDLATRLGLSGRRVALLSDRQLDAGSHGVVDLGGDAHRVMLRAARAGGGAQREDRPHIFGQMRRTTCHTPHSRLTIR